MILKESECFPGKRVGKLTLIKKIRLPSGRYTRGGWLCKCDCGNLTKVRTDCLGDGGTISCGCYNKEHNYANSNHKLHQKYSGSDSQSHSRYYKIYHTWLHIKDRCYNPRCKSYSNYGGRGIKMCDEWKNNYQAFKNWSLSHDFHQTSSPMDMTIDRIDVNGNYEPSNCRWVGIDIQANNKRNSHYIVFHGKRYTVATLAHKYNLNRVTIYRRLKLGWTGDRLVSKPYEYKNTKKVGN